MELKIIPIIGDFIYGLRYTQYVTCIQVMIGKVVSYEVGNQHPFIFEDESLLNQTLLLLRSDLLNNDGIFKVKIGDIPLLTYDLDNIKSDTYNKGIEYNSFTYSP